MPEDIFEEKELVADFIQELGPFFLQMNSGLATTIWLFHFHKIGNNAVIAYCFVFFKEDILLSFTEIYDCILSIVI